MAQDEVMKQLMGLRQFLEDQSQQLEMVRSQMAVLAKEHRRSELTLKEVHDVPEGVKMYKSVGKMFVVQSKKRTETELRVAMAKYERELETLKSTEAYLSRKGQEAQKQFGELVGKLQPTSAVA